MRVDRIVCLANSYKHDNRCVAGISLTTRKWLRLVGKTVPGCLTRRESSYHDGKEAALLDIFEVELGTECGSNSHPEDVFVSGRPWRFLRRFDQAGDPQFFAQLSQPGPSLLGSCSDRVDRGTIDQRPVECSLELVQPEDLWWWIRDEKGKRRNRAVFRLGHECRIRYDLPVTDPHWLEGLNLLPEGIYRHAVFFREKPLETYLAMSLSEVFEGFHYKLVAGVVSLPASAGK